MLTAHASLRRKVAGASLIAAPLLLAISELTRVLSRGAPNSQTSYASQILALCALAAFVPAVLGLMHLLRLWSARATLLAGASALVGILGVISTVTLRLLLWGFGNTLPPDQFVQVRNALPPQILATIFLPGLLFGLSLAVLAVGLYQTRAVARPAALLVLFGGILFPIGSVPDIPAIIAPAALALVTGLAWIGRDALAMSAVDWDRFGATA